MTMICVLVLAGCATRQVTSVAMSQPGDDALSCDALDRQIADNNSQAAIYGRKDKQVENQNVAKGIGSAVPIAGLAIAATTDLSNAEQVKARSLADRNQQLEYLAKRKGCAK